MLKTCLTIGLITALFTTAMAQNQPQQGNDKLIVYQIFTRLFGNENTTNEFNGSISENGSGKFNAINKKALRSLKKLGVSHVWYTGVIEHATMSDYSTFGISKDNPLVVKGRAGSPYAIKDYYDIDPDLAEDVPNRMAEFEALIKRSHTADLKVLIDFIPNHVAREYHSDVKPDGVFDFGEDDDDSKTFAPNNNFYYLPNEAFVVPDEVDSPVKADKAYFEKPAKATGNDVFSASPTINDWFETMKLNYGVDYLNNRQKHFESIPDTWLKMKDILLYWAEKGVDGFRCDMAEMVPVEFWEWVIKEVKTTYPDVIFIAEIYNPDAYHDYIFRGGFDYLYDKVGLYDALRRLIEGHGNANDITAVWQNESGEFANHMLRFLENHDEQRVASKEFGGEPFKALPAMALSAYLHSGPLMLYMGQELGINPTEAEGFQGADGRTTIFDYWGLDEMAKWNNNGKWNTNKLSASQKELRDAYQFINEYSVENEAIHSGKFFDLQYFNMGNTSYNDNRIFSLLRYSDNQKLLFVFNFDQSQPYKFGLKIPELAYEMMGIHSDEVGFKPIRQIDKLLKSGKRVFNKSESIPVEIAANSWKVIELE